MVNHHKVEGFDAFKAKVTELAATKSDVFVMFSGSKDADGVRYKQLIFFVNLIHQKILHFFIHTFV